MSSRISGNALDMVSFLKYPSNRHYDRMCGVRLVFVRIASLPDWVLVMFDKIIMDKMIPENFDKCFWQKNDR